MVTIYLACRGTYSDFDIIGAFTDKATAELVAKAVDDTDGGVREFEVDAPGLLAIATEAAKYEPGLSLWRAYSEHRQIEVRGVHQGYYEHAALRRAPGAVAACIDIRGAEQLMVTMLARGKEHAIKIAADKFREYAALTGWPGKPVAAPSS